MSASAADDARLDTPEIHTPALTPRASQPMDSPDDIISPGDRAQLDLALALESASIAAYAQAHDTGNNAGDNVGNNVNTLSGRDRNRLDDDEVTRGFLFTPPTAPETPLVSIPNTTGLSYSANHSDRVTLTGSRTRASSTGDDSETEQAQGLDQAQDILNGLDV